MSVRKRGRVCCQHVGPRQSIPSLPLSVCLGRGSERSRVCEWCCVDLSDLTAIPGILWPCERNSLPPTATIEGKAIDVLTEVGGWPFVLYCVLHEFCYGTYKADSCVADSCFFTMVEKYSGFVTQ